MTNFKDKDMHNSDKYLHIAEIIAQIELGVEITSSWQMELDEWLGESERNRELYDRITCRESFEKYEKTVASVDFRQMVESVRQKVRQRGRRRTMRRIASASAAAVLIVVGVFALRMSVADHRAPLAGVIGPGTTQALMVLPDGHRIELGAQQPEEALREYLVIGSTGRETAWEPTQKIRIEIPRGGEYSFTLADGTTVWLNSETVIEYPGQFADGCRKVYLSGEAFFDVSRDSLSPFGITTPDGLDITVLGTRFNVNNYNDTGRACITLAEGSVAVSHGGERLTLRPDQQAVFDRVARSLAVHDVPDAGIFSAWTGGKFVFEFAEIEDIMKQFERWYDVEVEYEYRPAQRFGGSISRNIDLAGALGLLKITEAVDFEIKGDKVIVKKIEDI